MKLSAEQRRIIDSEVKDKLVLAGPGTGKTFTLLGYVTDLILRKQANPKDIYILTFTKSTSQELKKKFFDDLNDFELMPKIYTIHGFALRQLMKNPTKINFLPSNFSIADDFEEQEIVNNDLKRYLRIDFKTVKKLFCLLASNWETLSADRSSWKRTFESPEFLGAWQEHRSIYGYILRSEMVYQFQKALEKIIDLKIDYPIEHLIVDEYQDLNKCELKTIKTLWDKGARLLAAGDDDQSIYGFRYAYPEGIRNFCDDITNSQKFNICDCHRCDSEILEFSLNIIRQDYRRMQKNITSVTKERGIVKVICFSNQHKEAEAVAKIIEHLKKSKGYQDNDFLILLRSDSKGIFSTVIQDALKKREITISTNSKDSLFENDLGRLFISFIKYASNNQNDLALRTILMNTRGIGDTQIDKIYEYAKTHKLRFNVAVERIIDENSIATSVSTVFKNTISQLNEAVNQFNNIQENFSDKIGVALAFVNDNPFSINMLAYLKNNKIESIMELIEHVTIMKLMESADQSEIESIGTRIMTMHQSKGLSSEVVFIIGVEDEYLPGKGDVDEERRLLYVSATRAKHYLFLTFCNNRIGQQQYTGSSKKIKTQRNLSRFIDDIPGLKIVEGCKLIFEDI